MRRCVASEDVLLAHRCLTQFPGVCRPACNGALLTRLMFNMTSYDKEKGVRFFLSLLRRAMGMPCNLRCCAGSWCKVYV